MTSMRMSKLMARTLRDVPKDAELVSHRFLLRAGMIRQYTAGVYGLLPLARKSIAKIEKIIREEMDAIEGQEITMPCLATATLWSESGRYSAIGKDMFRLKDRHDRAMVLNMTHEEPVVYLARTELTSYKQLPAMVYQIQNKYRDEPRPRGGLIRLREFSMKDAYSFHSSEKDLHDYYWRAHAAYARVFQRCGLKNVVSVQSDNGMFGGKFSHEFQVLTPSGEDKLITCEKCDYKANSEIATSPYYWSNVTAATTQKASEKIATPGVKTIEELCAFLKIEPQNTLKAVMFQDDQGKAVIAFVRGDLDVVDKKIQSLILRGLQPAKEEAILKAGAIAGSTGPRGLTLTACTVVLDHTTLKTIDATTGANQADSHITHFDLNRDFLDLLSPEEKKQVMIGDIAAARPGDPCPNCAGVLQETRGIEVGNIFHLGTKYSESMKCTYLDQQGKAQNHIMGCYGIGVTRLLPSVIEESHDDRGIIFPISIAPMEVHLCVLNRKEMAVLEYSEKLYQELKAAGVEVLLDDRDEKAGSQFADADLMGIPFRIVVSPKTLGEQAVEYSKRDKSIGNQMVPISDVIQKLQTEIKAEHMRYS